MKNNSHGFSLMELVVVIGIFAVCSVILTALFIGQNRMYETETAELNITSDARTVFDDVDNYVRQSIRVISSYSSYTTGPQVLILQVQSVNASNQLVAGTYDYIVYYLTGTNFNRTIFPDPASSRPAVTKQLASRINSLAFTYNNADYSLVTAVTTDLTAQQDVGFQTRSITLSSKSKIRGYQ